MHGSTPQLTLTVVQGALPELDDLREEWRELLAHSTSPSLVRTHSWCRTGFCQMLLRDDKYSFKALLVREGTRLVGLWPFIVRRGRFLSEASTLCSGSFEEYGGPIIRAGSDTRSLSQAFLSGLSQVADFLKLYNLPANHCITDDILARKGPKTADIFATPYMDFENFKNFEEYLETRSKPLRTGAKYQERRLEKLGVTFSLLETKEEVNSALEWILSRKQDWVRENRKNTNGPNGRWLMNGGALEFFTAAANSQQDLGRPAVFVLRSDSETIAGGICLIDENMVEYYITTYNPQWAAYSPGKVLILKLAGWAFERGRNFDFRMKIGPGYKDSWTNAERYIVSTVVAGTALGLLPVCTAKVRHAMRRLRRAAAKALPRSLVEKLRAG